jgi:Flp pilus assembly protein TadG
VRRRRERGQGLVEFAMVVPAFLLLVLGILEFGLMFDHLMTISYATREGARSGAAFASGNDSSMVCTTSVDVDKHIMAAVQRVLDAPGSQVKTPRISEVRIYNSTSSGVQSGSAANVWVYSAGAGPIVDGAPLDFQVASTGWNACTRDNTWTGSAAPDSIGVSIVYDYQMATALGAVIGFFGPNGPPTMRISDRTVMALNPTD